MIFINNTVIPEDYFYCFEVYQNPRTGIKSLLFKGVAYSDHEKLIFIHKYDWFYTQYGYTKLRNYYDMVKKLGELPCRIITHDKLLLDNVVYSNQKEIAKKYNIKVSALQKRAFKETDFVGAERMMKYLEKEGNEENIKDY